MSSIFTAVIGLFLIMAPATSYAGSQHLFFVGGENKPGVWKPVSLVTDENGDAVGINIGKVYYPAAAIKNEVQIKVEGKSDDLKLVYLKGANVDPKTGGQLNLRYLHDGVGSPTYHNFGFELKRMGNDWKVLVNGKVIKSLYMTLNTLPIIGTEIGIDTIKPTYAANDATSDDARAERGPNVINDNSATKDIFPGGTPDAGSPTQAPLPVSQMPIENG